MHLPADLYGIPEDPAVIGDLDALVHYIESGQAAADWWRLHLAAKKLLWAQRTTHD